MGLAGVLLESQKADLALPHLKRAIELDSNDEVAWYRLARAQRMTGDAEGLKRSMAEFQRIHAHESEQRAKTGILPEAADVTPQQIGSESQP